MGQTFRVFLSSTFSDFRRERKALQETVFPRLQDLCVGHESRFQAIDLRWGVSQDAGLGQQAMAICLGEIERCQRVSPKPNFIALLGDRYGWRPLPSQIVLREHARIRAEIDASRADYDAFSEPVAGIRALELLDRWYARDDNGLETSYLLRPRLAGSPEAAYGTWEGKVERPLGAILRLAANRADLPAEVQFKYWASATHQEIQLGALAGSEAGDHVWGFLRNIDNLFELTAALPDPAAQAYLDTDELGLQDASSHQHIVDLKDTLTRALPGHIYRYDARWTDSALLTDQVGTLPAELDECLPMLADAYEPTCLCEAVWRALGRTIDAECGRRRSAGPLGVEKKAHRAFGEERAAGFVGRKALLESVEMYLASDALHLLAICGDGGIGKSAVIARAAMQAELEADSVVVLRHIGATPESNLLLGLLKGICLEIEGPVTAESRVDLDEWVRSFQRLLAVGLSGRRLIVFIDGLDQLGSEGAAHELAWLPKTLGRGVRLVVSLQGREGGLCYPAMVARQPAGALLEMEPLADAEAAALVDRWLAERGRRVTEGQRRTILDCCTAAGGLPLYLRLACGEAAQWHSTDDQAQLSRSVQGLIRAFVKRLKADSEHGEVMVHHSLGYLAAARHGLTEEELLDALSLDEAVLRDLRQRSPDWPETDRLPVVVWSRLFFDLAPYLSTRNSGGAEVMVFFDRQLAEIVNADCLDSGDGEARHAVLGRLFAERWRRPDAHAISELPYHLARGGMPGGEPDALPALLTDLAFLEAKCAAEMAYELLADFELQAAVSPSNEAAVVRSAIVQSLAALVARPELSLQTIYNRLAPAVRADVPLTTAINSGRLRLDEALLWFRAAAPLSDEAQEGTIQIPFDMQSDLQSLSSDGTTLAIGETWGEVEVRSIDGGAQLEKREIHGKFIVAIAICERPRRLAWMSANGQVRTDETTDVLEGRRDESLLLYHPDGGVIAARSDDALVAWQPRLGRFTVLAEQLPAPLACLRFSADGRSVVFVAGFNQPVVGLCSWNGTEWQTRRITYDGTPILAADVDLEAGVLLAAGRDKSLQAIECETGRVVARVAYEQRSESGIIGAPVCCAAGAGGWSGRAVFGTRKGNVGIWDWRTDQLEKAADGHAPTDGSRFIAMSYIPRSTSMLYTTARMGASVATSQARQARTRHGSAVLGCCFTSSGRVVSTGLYDKGLMWSAAEGLQTEVTRIWDGAIQAGITCLAQGSSVDDIVAGNKRGWVWFQPPDREVESIEVLHIFEGPVQGIFLETATDGPGPIVAADRVGRVMRVVDIEAESTEVLRFGSNAEDVQRLQPSREKDSYWLVHRDKTGTAGSALTFHTGSGSQEVFRCPGPIADVTVNVERDLVAVAADGVKILGHRADGWSPITSLPIDAAVVGWIEDDVPYLVLVTNEARPWLELWTVAGDARRVASAELPGPVTCMGIGGRRIALGCESGDLVSYSLEIRRDVASHREGN